LPAIKASTKKKPPVSWIEKEFDKPIQDTRKDLQDILGYWKLYIDEKMLIVRSEKTIGRLNNMRHTLVKFQEKKNHALTFDVLDQKFFNVLVDYMVNEHEHSRSKQHNNEESGVLPTIGLNNDTAIKRLKDFTEYLKYCVLEHDVDINLEKIKKYIKLAKHKLEVRP
jgi:hypothetical protein